MEGKMPRVTQLGHTGIYVDDLARMRDFYTRVLGLTVTDEDEERGMVFLSSRPDQEHHELVLMRGRKAPPDARLIQQISWHVGSVDDLLAFHQLLGAEGVTVEREVTHGIALGIYFLDPEGNRIEVYWPTDQRVPQPFGRAIDLDQPAEAVLAQAQALLPDTATSSSR
jgi:catechol 2,3-dioxygenase-like lactoylglutathione lyase family enzyme